MNANHEAFLILLKYSHYYHVKGNIRVRNWWTIVTMNAIKHMIKVIDCVDIPIVIVWTAYNID